MKRYLQLWHQLSLIDDVVCRTYKLGPTSDFVTVPLIPTKLQQEALHQSHDQPSAGHQGTVKTLTRLQQDAYIYTGLEWRKMSCHHISGPGGPFMFNIIGPARPLMLS